jgi:periplasmic divalent cation tolerance protein
MSQMILIYTTCKNIQEAKSIGKFLLEKHLIACVNIIPRMESMSLWPPKTGKIESISETILIIKTLDKNYRVIEKQIRKLHSYSNPAIFAIPITHVSNNYHNWLMNEVI